MSGNWQVKIIFNSYTCICMFDTNFFLYLTRMYDISALFILDIYASLFISFVLTTDTYKKITIWSLSENTIYFPLNNWVKNSNIDIMYVSHMFRNPYTWSKADNYLRYVSEVKTTRPDWWTFSNFYLLFWRSADKSYIIIKCFLRMDE